MLDPISIGIIAWIAICFIVMYLYAYINRDGFEQVFDEDARKLLNQDDKPKTKGKIAKNKPDSKGKKEIRDIDIDKFFSRLLSISELEPEYLSFITGHLQMLACLIEKLEESYETVQQCKVGIETKIELHKNARIIAEAKLADIKVEMSEINSKMKKTIISEQELSNNLNTAQKKCSDITTALAKATDERSKLQNEIRKLNENLGESSSTVVKLEMQVKEKDEEIVSLLSKNRKLEATMEDYESLKAEFSGLKLLYEEMELKEKLLEEKITIGQKRLDEAKSQASSNQLAARSERDDLMAKWKEERKQWNLEEQKIREQYNITKSLVDQLAVELDNFEAYKKEEAKSQQTSTNGDEMQHLKDTIHEHVQEIENLRLEKELLKEQIKMQHEQDFSNISKLDKVEQLLMENERLREINKDLSERSEKASVDMTSITDQVARLSEVLRTQESRSDEERVRERRILADLLTPLAQQPLEDLDLKKFSTWLGSAIHSTSFNAAGDKATVTPPSDIDAAYGALINVPTANEGGSLPGKIELQDAD